MAFLDDHEEKLLKYLSLTPKSKQEELRECQNGLGHYRKQYRTLGLSSNYRKTEYR